MKTCIILACAVVAALCYSVPGRTAYVQPSPVEKAFHGLYPKSRNTKSLCNSFCACASVGCNTCHSSCPAHCCKPIQPRPQYPVAPHSYVLAPSTAGPTTPPKCCNVDAYPTTAATAPTPTSGYATTPECVPCTTMAPATAPTTVTTEAPTTTTIVTKKPCTEVPTEASTTTAATEKPCTGTSLSTTPTTVATPRTSPTAVTAPTTVITTAPEVTTVSTPTPRCRCESTETSTTPSTTTTTKRPCNCNQATTATTQAPVPVTVQPCCNNCNNNCDKCHKQTCKECQECATIYPVVIVTQPETTCFVDIKEVKTTISVYCGCTSEQGVSVVDAITRCTAVSIDVSYYKQISLFFPGTYACSQIFTRITSIEQYIKKQCSQYVTQPVVVPGYPVVPVNPATDLYPTTELIPTNGPLVDSYNVITTTTSSSASVVSWVAISASVFALVVAFVTAA